jgi:hypothetical protein
VAAGDFETDPTRTCASPPARVGFGTKTPVGTLEYPALLALLGPPTMRRNANMRALGFCLLLMACLFPISSFAAEALAIGPCDEGGYSYGYTYNIGSIEAAERQALDQCRAQPTKDATPCKVVQSVDHSCVALSLDRARACGPVGSANAATRNQAERLATSVCRQYGGRNCAVIVSKCETHVTVPGTGGAGGFPMLPCNAPGKGYKTNRGPGSCD